MTAANPAVQPRPLAEPAGRRSGGRGGGSARRAVVRWAWRLFRREWRQQLLVLALLTVAVAATTAGVSVATNAAASAETVVTVPGPDPQLAADIAAFRQAFPEFSVFAHQQVAVPGSIASVDLRAEEAKAPGTAPAVRLRAGRFPAGPGEVAVTDGVAALFDLQIGSTWTENGSSRRVVGLVENPQNLHDEFGLVAPGQANPPDTVTFVSPRDHGPFEGFRLPSRLPLSIETSSAAAKAAVAAGVLAIATIGLLLVGLVSVAGFTVMAQRRQRALGMLGAVGATDRQVRLVMLANGAAAGVVAAVVGAALGLLTWMALAGRIEQSADHRIDRFAVPWWAIGAAMLLAVATAVVAAWWPARSAARVSIVTALSGRPPRPRPARHFAAVGGVLLVAGVVCLAFTHQTRPLLIVAGTVTTTLGVLLLAPLTIRVLAAGAGRWPVAVRLALRDLARYQARSGAALGAISLAVGIAATIAINASATQATSDRSTGGNLAADQLVVYLAPHGGGGGGGVPEQTPAQQQAVQTAVDAVAASVGTRDVVALDVAIDPDAPDVPAFSGNQGGKDPVGLVKVTQLPRGFSASLEARLYVATPELLTRAGVPPSQVRPDTDIVSSRTDLAGLQLGAGRDRIVTPKIQRVGLPRYSSGPNTLITLGAVDRLGLRVIPAAWLVQASHPLTAAQVNAARKQAATAGLTIETRPSQASLARVRDGATAAGMLMALGMLAMTVGLIRSETANDLRTLAATGATSTTRRTVTGTTAGALALLGALLGTAGAYLALVAWHRSDLSPLGHPPIRNLLAVVVGLPLVALAGGWLLAGREPPAMARRPLE